jgi:hypothetical protein
MRRPNLSFPDNVDVALTLVASASKTTKSKVAEKALRMYLLTRYEEACKIANLLPVYEVERSFYDGASIGHIAEMPVYADKEGFLYRVEEGQQMELSDAGGIWCAWVEYGEWNVTHSSKFPYGKFDDNSQDIVSNSPSYEPDEYELEES